MRLADERGFSLTELLVVMSLLGVLMGGLSTMFVSSTRQQDELNRRFQAQSQARVVMDKLRIDLFCASEASGGGTSVTLTTQPLCESTGTVRWCTVASGTGRFKLLRATGATSCTTAGREYADYLSAGSIFSIGTPTTSKLFEVRVDLRIKQQKMATPYRLCDVLVLRNSQRVAWGGTATSAGSC